MKFGPASPADAIGGVTVHTLRQGSLVLKKGTTIGLAEVEALNKAGVKEVVVVRLEQGDVSEDVAAASIAEAVAGEGVNVERAFTGRSNLFAAQAGVLVVDPRTAFASPERFPDVPLIAEWPDVALPPLNIDHYTAFVAVTHDPKIDDPALLHAFARDCFYIGALGSRKTHAKRAERLKAQGASDADIARIHAPIGLSIGAVSPSEIAVSIMAEITAELRLPKENVKEQAA